MATVELPAPKAPSAVAEKEPPPAPEDEEEDEAAEEDDDEPKAASLGVLKSSEGGALSGPVGVFAPLDQGGSGVGGLGLSGSGTGQGFGSGRLGGSSSRTPPPAIGTGSTDVKGRIPPEVIARTVRQHFAKFRLCYEKGLMTDPTLAGKVMTRFTIAKDGTVSDVSDAGSTMKDKSVTACVHKAFKGLSFPKPEGGGIVVVNYPIMFSPGSSSPPAAASSPAAPSPPPPAPPSP